MATDIYASLAIGRVMGTGLAAAGTNQATATPLVNSVNEITTAASGSGVLLQDMPVGSDAQLVMNRGANAVLVYPQPGMKIEGAAVNAPASLAAGATASFRYTSAVQVRQN